MRMAKAWVSMVGSVVTALTAALSDDAFNVNDATQVAMTAVAAVITLIAVYATPNRPL